MRAALSIDLDTSALHDIEQLLQPSQYKKILGKGSRVAAQSVKTSAAKSISSKYGIASARIKQDIRGPYVKSDDRHIIVEIYFARVGPSGMRYNPKQTKSGLTLRIFKGEKTTIPNGLIQTTKKGQRFTFKTSQSRPYRPDLATNRRKSRKGLDAVYGPSTGSIFLGQSRFGDLLRQQVEDRTAERFQAGVAKAFRDFIKGYSN
jgi:hypothetical protein